MHTHSFSVREFGVVHDLSTEELASNDTDPSLIKKLDKLAEEASKTGRSATYLYKLDGEVVYMISSDYFT